MEPERFLEWLRIKTDQEKLIAVLSVIGLLTVFTPLVLEPFASSTTYPHSAPSAAALSLSSFPLYLQAFDFPEQHHSELQRPLFAYSVIPRGATSARELSAALRHDPVAAAHYSSFRTASAHLIWLRRDRKAYVSYRLGNKIYWTSKKVTLHAGETFLSDGQHLARTRCGNRLSDVPLKPTSPSEPPSPVLNTPVHPGLPELAPDPYPNVPIWEENPPSPIILSQGPTPGSPSGPGGFFPPIFPVPCCGGSPKPSPPPPILPQPGPPVATPEPGSLILLSAGLAGLLILHSLRRS